MSDDEYIDTLEEENETIRADTIRDVKAMVEEISTEAQAPDLLIAGKDLGLSSVGVCVTEILQSRLDEMLEE